MAQHELRIVAALGEQRVHHGEHQRGIGIRPDGNPLRAEKIRRIGFDRADGDEVDAGLFRPAQPGFETMGSRPA